MAHTPNGDEDQYANKIANYTKGLLHEGPRGEVNLASFNSLMTAVNSGNPADFEAIVMGAPAGNRVKFVNPQSGLAFDLEGTDSNQLVFPAPPKFNSAEEAGEIVENYWMALLRDVPFDLYPTSALAQAAADDLNRLTAFRGNREPSGPNAGRVTP